MFLPGSVSLALKYTIWCNFQWPCFKFGILIFPSIPPVFYVFEEFRFDESAQLLPV